jgi:hypothetical protein
MDTRSFLLSRPVRIAIDVLFLVMSGVYLVQDRDHSDRVGMWFWGVFVAFWLVMLVLDAVRTPRGARAAVDA